MKLPEDSLSIAIYEYAETVDSNVLSKLNRRSKERWSALIRYGIERGEFQEVDIDGIVNTILFSYQGVRMWGKIVPMKPKTFRSITDLTILGKKSPTSIGITYNWTSFSHSLRVGFYQMAFMCVGAIMLVAVILHIFMYQKAIRPLKKIQTGVREYREKKDSAVTVERMSEITAGNEFGTLAGDVSELALEIDRYTEENIRLSTEQERVIAELDMARSIQAGQLPRVFPAFPDRKEFDIYASMIPARAVGGDFYDFFFIDDDHLALVIADVSGKGVPAALFMMMSRIIISNYAMMGLSPAEVLRRSNDTIFRNNKEHMFVTAWFGIYEVSTGRVVAANAGHEYPVLRDPEGEYSYIPDTHGFVLGGMKNQTYEEYTFILQKGCTLVVYTDGYPEAMDSKGKMFGKERLKEALNRMPDADPKTLSEHALKSVMNYVGEAEQFDDLTMLILKRL